MVNLGVAITLLALTPTATAKKPASVARAAPSSPRPASTRTVEGRFARYLESPDGKIDGVVLVGGTVARLAPRQPTFVTSLLRKGDPVRVRGDVVSGLPGPYLVHASLNRSNVLKTEGMPADLPPATPNMEKRANPSAIRHARADDILVVQRPRLPQKRGPLKTAAQQLRRLTTGSGREPSGSPWSRRRENESP